MTATDDREARLPKWAQSELRRLRNEIDRLNRVVADEADATKPGLSLHIGFGQARALDPDAHVTWTFGGDEHRQIEARRATDHRFGEALGLRARHGRLVVMSTGGVNSLLIAGDDWS